MTRPHDRFAEPGWWGVLILVGIITAIVYFFTGCATKAEVDITPIVDVAAVKVEKQTQTIDAEGDVTVINIGSVGWGASAMGAGLSLFYAGRRKPLKGLDRVLLELRRGSVFDIPAKSVIRNIGNVGKVNGAYDRTEQYIHSRVKLAKKVSIPKD